jgi:ubiquinone/menaquinone biosynthesis C-methylase UbiE
MKSAGAPRGGKSPAKTTYESYISNHPGIAACQKEALLNFLNLRGRLAPTTNSNRQLKALVDDLQRRNSFEQMARLRLMLGHFSSDADVDRIIAKIAASNVSDKEAIAYIMSANSQKKKKDEYVKCTKWEYVAQCLALRENSVAKPKSYKYLDFGCGSGSKTVQFQKALKISKSQVFCTDVETWGPYKTDKKKLPFQFEYIVDNALAYENNTFDFITCIFTLHHIPNLTAALAEIRRVLKPGGSFVIIEHSVYTDHDRLLVHIQHAIYSAIYDGRANAIEAPDYIECRNMYEWEFALESAGFVSIEKNIVSYGTEFALSYENSFYAVFTKE